MSSTAYCIQPDVNFGMPGYQICLKRADFLYGAAHALGLAALRWHGYRPGNRYLVFQSLQYTVGFKSGQWRVLDACHRQRNLAEYEGHLEVPASLLDDLSLVAGELLERVQSLGKVR